MAVTVKQAILWRREMKNVPGELEKTLRPLKEAGISLQVVMGYSFPGEPDQSAVEVYPITGAEAEKAAKKAGLSPAKQIACLVVEGDDRPGLGQGIAMQLAQEKINIHFLVVQVTGKRYLGVFGFGSQKEAVKATPIIKEAADSISRNGNGRARQAGGRSKTAVKSTVKSTTAARASGTRKTSARAAGTRKTASRAAGGTNTTARTASASTRGKSSGSRSTARNTTTKTAARAGRRTAAGSTARRGQSR